MNVFAKVRSCNFCLYSQLLKLVHLFGSREIFVFYFQTIESFRRKEKRSILYLRLFMLAFSLKAAHYLALYLFQDRMSTFQNAVQYNFIAMEGQPAYYNFYFILGHFLCYQSICLLFKQNTGFAGILLRHLLLEDNHSFYLHPKYSFTRPNTIFKLLFKYNLNANRISSNIQFIAILLINICNCLICIITITFIAYYFTQYSLFRVFFQLNTVLSFLQFILLNFNFLFALLTIIVLFYTIFLVGFLGILFLIIVFIKLEQIEAYLASELKRSRGRLPERAWHTFLYHNQLSLYFLADVNRLFGNYFFTFLLINMPLNATVLMNLLLNRTSLSVLVQFILSLLLALQLIFFLLVSFYAFTLTLKFHAPSKVLLVLHGKLLIKWPLSSRLKLNRYLEQFHTRNLYTLNYGKFSKITYKSAGRNVFFYMKLIIFAYRLVND